jgi:hypothetical protein
MQNLQQMIDAAFGTQADRERQRPTEAYVERERVHAEQKQKVETLRRARSNSVDSQRPSTLLLFEVVRHRGHWRVLHCERHSNPFPDLAAAIMAAKSAARKKQNLGHSVVVRLVRTDGQVVPQPLDTE